jgi:class 3 adenylate cyclase
MRLSSLRISLPLHQTAGGYSSLLCYSACRLRPHMAGTRKIAAILVADIVGYSRLAGADEDRTLSRLRGLRSDLIDPAIDAHHGRIVKRTGDGILVEFRSVVGWDSDVPARPMPSS